MCKVWRVSSLTCAILVGACCLAPLQADAASICLTDNAAGACASASTTTIAAATSFFDLYLVIDGVDHLHGWNLWELRWDESVIALQDASTPSVAEGGFLSANAAICSSTPCSTSFSGGFAFGPGSLSLAFGALADADAEAAGTGTLAIFRFVPIGVGATPLTFISTTGDPADVNDPIAGAFFLTDSLGNALSFTAVNGAVEVTAPAPEPASLVLLGGGMLALALRQRRRRSHPV